MRDMVQNHLMQLLAITAMEPPARFDKNGFRNEVIKVYQSLRPLTDEYIRQNVVRGQYMASGEGRVGYREEKNVRPDSRTDTYVAMCLYVDNWRWQGVPFYIRTGKQMPTKVTEIVVHFKPAPMRMFQMKEEQYRGEALILRIQPDEGVLQRIAMKPVPPVSIWVRWRWTIAMDGVPGKRAMPMCACWRTAWRETRLCSPVRMPLRKAGPISTGYWSTGGSIPTCRFMVIRPGLGDPRKRTR